MFTIRRTVLIVLSLLIVRTSFEQKSSGLNVPNYIRLPIDSLLRVRLINSLDSFMGMKEKENRLNPYVLKEDLPETSLLLDEMKGAEISELFKDSNFFKGYVNNIVQLNDSVYNIQLSFLGEVGNTPVLGSFFSLVARNRLGKFYFSSILKTNTAHWKTMKINWFYKN